jgi:hypothetical protein
MQRIMTAEEKEQDGGANCPISKILKQNILPSKLFNKMPLYTLFFYFSFLFHIHYYALFIFFI